MKYYINRLYLKNFKCVGREDGLMVELGIEQGLENGVIALSGPNGFGKTTIFDAIQIAFCDEIDRINEINPKNKKIKDNIYIYGNKDYAIIALELVNINNNDKITIIKKIERMNDNNEKNRKNCINSFWTNEEININKLDNNDYGEKIDDLGKFLENNIGLKKDYYTSFYYVSQDNSINYLRKDSKGRRELFDVLMGIEEQIEMESKLGKILNEKTANGIGNAIEKKKNNIISELKMIHFKDEKVIQYQDYVRIFTEENIEWDNSNYIIEDLTSINEVQKIIALIENFELYKIRMNNNIVNKYICDKNLLEKCVYLIQHTKYESSLSFEENITGSIDTLNEYKNICDSKEKIKKYSFKGNSIVDTIRFLEGKLNLQINIENINDLIDDIIKENQKMDKNKSAIKELKESIEELNKVFFNVVEKENQNICPFCKTSFDNVEDIKKRIRDNIEELDKDISFKYKNKEDEIEEIFKNIILQIDEYIDKKNTVTIEYAKIDIVVSNLRTYLKDKYIINLFLWFENNNILKDILRIVNERKKEIIDEVTKVLEKKLKEEKEEYTDKQFDNDNETFGKYIINETYLKWLEESKTTFLDTVYKKKMYFEYQLYKKDSEREIIIRNKIKELIKLEKLEEVLKGIRSVYKKEISNFKKKVICDIEIPLFIFTGKIIQTYQRGLGVFIREDKNTDNIVFTPNPNETEHDIVNTFSSGQLSAFTIAFLLVMNQLYVFKDKDKGVLNTILIDDPVQTMDDINIASLVEVLRNQFSEYQIIISTHETEKVDYIRYKFNKFGIKTKEYNVKKHFFDNK